MSDEQPQNDSTEQQAEEAPQEEPSNPAAQDDQAKISIDDFAKVEMTVGEIKTAEKVENADKLLRLTVDVGESELRQIVSGIAMYFPDPESLVGKRVPFVTNLKPRTIRGLESNGMILAASHDGNFSLLEVNDTIPAGTQLA